MHPADTVLPRDWRKFCLHIDRQTNHFVFLRPTLQILAVVVQRRQNLTRMNRFHQMITAKRFAYQNAQIWFPCQLKDTVDASRRPPVLAQQLKVPWIRFRNKHLGSDIRRFSAILDFNGLRQNLVFFAGAQEKGCALQRWIGECGNAQIVVLAFGDFGDCRQFEFGEVSV